MKKNHNGIKTSFSSVKPANQATKIKKTLYLWLKTKFKKEFNFIPRLNLFHFYPVMKKRKWTINFKLFYILDKKNHRSSKLKASNRMKIHRWTCNSSNLIENLIYRWDVEENMVYVKFFKHNTRSFPHHQRICGSENQKLGAYVKKLPKKSYFYAKTYLFLMEYSAP